MTSLGTHFGTRTFQNTLAPPFMICFFNRSHFLPTEISGLRQYREDFRDGLVRIFGGFVDFRVIYIFFALTVAFYGFQCVFPVNFHFYLCRRHNFLKVGKVKPWGGRTGSIILISTRAESLFYGGFQNDGGPRRGIFLLVEFCPCLILFMDIGCISENVDFKSLFQLI